MNQLVNPAVITMSSKEIAELVNSKHGDVKRSAERLLVAGILTAPLAQFEFNHNGNTYTGYNFNKRDSLVLVARLSPEFTAAVVDRWQELELANKPQLPGSYIEALEALVNSEKQKQALEAKVAIDAPKVDFAERVEKSSGVLIGDFGKAVGIGQNRLFAWLRAQGYLIATAGTRHNTPYQRYIDSGHFDVTEQTYEIPSGETRSRFTPHITGKGQVFITTKLKECGMIKEVV